MSKKQYLGTTPIGILADWMIEDTAKAVMFDALNLAFDEALEDGLIDRPVELILREAEGISRGGRLSDVVNAFDDLVSQGVVGIYGPWISENAIGLRGHVEASAKVPCLSMTGTDRWYGEWCFNVNNGSLTEDSRLMVNYLQSQKISDVCVVYDRSSIGEEYRNAFIDACEEADIRILIQEGVNTHETDLARTVLRLRESNAGAVAYNGLGFAAINLGKEMKAQKWDPLRVMTSSFMLGPFATSGMLDLRGWIGIDQYDEQNVVGEAMLDRFEARYDYRPANWWALINYDIANIFAHGLARAHPQSGQGFKHGLERGVKLLPAANGGPGGAFSFAPYLRRGWLSSNFIVMREYRHDLSEQDAVLTAGPHSIMRHRFDPRPRLGRYPAN